MLGVHGSATAKRSQNQILVPSSEFWIPLKEIPGVVLDLLRNWGPKYGGCSILYYIIICTHFKMVKQPVSFNNDIDPTFAGQTPCTTLFSVTSDGTMVICCAPAADHHGVLQCLVIHRWCKEETILREVICFFCREIHHISKFQIESNRFISYHIIFMYVFGWMEGWCSSLLHPQSKLVKTTKGESSAQSESCEDQWFQCMDIYIYYTYMYIYQGWSSMIHIFISVRMERSICCPLLCKTWPCQFLQVMEDWTWNTLNGNQCWQSMGIWLVLWLLCSFPVIATYSGMLWIVLLHPK